MSLVFNTAEDLSKHFEGLYLNAYLCPSGIPTIGYGHTDNVQLGQRCTEAQANEWLRQDLAESYAAVDELVKVEITGGQREALADFVFNLGRGRLKDSTLLKLVNSGKFAEAADEFPKWCHGTDPKTGEKIKLDGLVRRRGAERELFLQGVNVAEPELPLPKIKAKGKAATKPQAETQPSPDLGLPDHNGGA